MYMNMNVTCACTRACMLEGCRWDDKIGQLGESFPKELFASIPVVLVKAVTVDARLA